MPSLDSLVRIGVKNMIGFLLGFAACYVCAGVLIYVCTHRAAIADGFPLDATEKKELRRSILVWPRVLWKTSADSFWS